MVIRLHFFHSIPIIVYFALFSAAAWFGASSAHAEANKPCAAKVFRTKELESACKAGGQQAAKELMKKVVTYSKTTSTPVKCKDCHKDLKAYEFTEKSLSDFKSLLADIKSPKPKK